jgi:GST-like protein
MVDLSSFPITKRWPARDPNVLQLYSLPTPNGVKVSIALEELGLPYEAHRVQLVDADVKSPEFLSLNPNNKIPAILDPHGPDGQPFGLFESGAILLYLAEKTGQLLPTTATARHHAVQWLMFQMGGVGPMFGQVGFFTVYGGKAIDDPRPRERYLNEAKRLLAVLEGQLRTRPWLVETYSVADIAVAPWLWCMRDHYRAGESVAWSSFGAVDDYLNRFLARPAVKRGLLVPAAP